MKQAYHDAYIRCLVNYHHPLLGRVYHVEHLVVDAWNVGIEYSREKTSTPHGMTDTVTSCHMFSSRSVGR